MAASPHLPTEASLALKGFGSAFRWTAVASGLVNVLYLAGSFFMLEVYDRVIPSRSVPTLLGLVALVLLLYGFQACLEALRARILTRIGLALDETLGPRAYESVARSPLRPGAPVDGLLPLRDLDQVRTFLAGAGPVALFDLPWMPVYLAVCFLFHPLLGLMALAGAILLAGLTLAADHASRAPSRAASAMLQRRNALAESGRRNAEVLAAMGMRARFAADWSVDNAEYLSNQSRLSDTVGGIAAVSKAARAALQSLTLALGAYLVINGQATSGVMIASSILVSRALAPAELAIANWKGITAARQSWARLGEALSRLPPGDDNISLPAPASSLTVEGISVAPPGVPRLVVQDLSLSLRAGQGLGIIGTSASGKSSLVRALVGVWEPLRGKVRLDHGALAQWPAEDLGRHIGYLPQEVELFPGNVARNVSRFDPDATPDAVIAAAKAAGVHEMILRLPEGYGTLIGEGGAGLSAGQRQRIGLARALYGDPFLVVLDEPNANLDTEGENALTQAMLGVRNRNGIVVVVAHRPSALAAVDTVLMMADGRAQALGPKDEILRGLMRPTAVPPVARPVPARVPA